MFAYMCVCAYVYVYIYMYRHAHTHICIHIKLHVKGDLSKAISSFFPDCSLCIRKFLSYKTQCPTCCVVSG